MATPKQATEKCSWGPHYPICKSEEEHEEDWAGNKEREQPRMHPQNMQQPQPQNTQCPQLQNAQQLQPQNTQHPQSFDSLTDTPNRFDWGGNGKKELKG